MKWRRKPKKEETEEEEKISLSKPTQIIVCLIMVCAVVLRLPPLAQGILFGFMPIVVSFDIARQKEARKEGGKWC